MDHAEVLARIEAAVAGPGGLARLVSDPAPESAAVREHVRGCPRCAAEWRAWSVVSLGLAAAAPETLEPRPALRDQVLSAASARPRSAPSVPAPATARVPVDPGAGPGTSATPARSGITMGPRRQGNGTRVPVAASASSSHTYRWLVLAAAAAFALFVVGAVVGRFAAGPAGPAATPGTAVTSPAAPRGDPGRVLSEMAVILQDTGHRLAPLQTTENDAGGVAVVSPDGRLAVVSSALERPADGTRYVCLLDRAGTRTQVGYMRWEPTSGGGLAYWAGDAQPPDLGMPGDVFIVQLDTPGAEPALTGEFLG